jgi:hypothetical protein
MSRKLVSTVAVATFIYCVSCVGMAVAADSISGSLAGKPTYNRIFTGDVDPNCNAPSTLSGVGIDVPYAVIPICTTFGENLIVTVNPAGTDIVDTTISLYCDPFDPSDATQNLIAFDDDDGAGLLSAFDGSEGAFLAPGNRYFLVLSLFAPGTIGGGNYQIDLGGDIHLARMLTVSTAGTGSGSVISTPAGIDCGVDCTEIYADGTVVTLMPTPAAGSSFDGWSGGGCSGLGACTVTMNADTTVTAAFLGPFEDSDGDGLTNIREQGPDGNDPNYDGNGDGIADRLQRHVCSFHAYTDDDPCYLTLETEPGHRIIYPQSLRTFDAPPPSGVSFPQGFFAFTITGIEAGDTTTVTVYPCSDPPQTYYKYGKSPDLPVDHWYEFDYDGRTGAERVGNTIVLHFVDGERGDHDLSANGEIRDPGGPAAIERRGVLYFPYINNVNGGETELGIINGQSYEAVGTIAYYGGEGESIGSSPLSLGAKGKVSIAPGEIPAGAASAVVVADGRLAGYTRHVSATGQRCSWPAARGLSRSITIPHCAPGPDWRTGLVLFNPNAEEASVSIGLDSGGSREVTLGPSSAEFLWLDATESARQITATGNITAIEVFESLAPGGDLAALLLRTSYLSSLYVPCIFYGPGTFTGVGFGRDGLWESTASLYGYRAAGGIEEISLGMLPSQGRIAINLSELLGPDTSCAEIFGELHSPTPFETSPAFYQGVVVYGEDDTIRLGAANLNALRFKEGFLAVVSSDLQPWFALINPSTEDATVTVIARGGDGAVLSSATSEISAGTNCTGSMEGLLRGPLPTDATHIHLLSNMGLYGLEIIYADGRLEVLPVLVAK